MLSFLIGLFVGCFVGMVLTALLSVNGDEKD